MADNSEKLSRILEQKALIDEAAKERADKAAIAENERLSKLANARGAWQLAYTNLRNAIFKVNDAVASAGIKLAIKDHGAKEPALAWLDIVPTYGADREGVALSIVVNAFGKMQVRTPPTLKMSPLDAEAGKSTTEDFEGLLLDFLSKDLERRKTQSDY